MLREIFRSTAIRLLTAANALLAVQAFVTNGETICDRPTQAAKQTLSVEYSGITELHKDDTFTKPVAGSEVRVGGTHLCVLSSNQLLNWESAYKSESDSLGALGDFQSEASRNLNSSMIQILSAYLAANRLQEREGNRRLCLIKPDDCI